MIVTWGTRLVVSAATLGTSGLELTPMRRRISTLMVILCGVLYLTNTGGNRGECCECTLGYVLYAEQIALPRRLLQMYTVRGCRTGGTHVSWKRIQIIAS